LTNNSPAPLDVRALIHNMYEGEKRVTAAEVFMSTADLEEVIRLGLQRAELEILSHLSGIIKVLVNQAKEGDIRASKLLFEAVGLVGRRDAGSTTTFVNQVNLSPQDIEKIVRGLDNIEATYESTEDD
jgi:hypothetical protein